MEENNKKTNRELILIIQNDLKHVQRRLEGIERKEWALIVGMVLLIISKVVFG